MSKKMAVVIGTYGLLGVALAFVVRQVASESPLAFYTTLALGAGCLVLGIIGLRRTVRSWVVLTSAVATFLLLTEVVAEWLGSGSESSAGRRLVVSAMFVFALGMVFYSVHAERPAGFYAPAGEGGLSSAMSKGNQQQPEQPASVHRGSARPKVGRSKAVV